MLTHILDKTKSNNYTYYITSVHYVSKLQQLFYKIKILSTSPRNAYNITFSISKSQILKTFSLHF